MKKIIFVDDSLSFGGAQIALINALKVLNSQTNYNIIIIVCKNNKILNLELSKLKNIQLFYCPSSYPANFIFFFLNVIYWIFLIRSFRVKEKKLWIINLPGIEFGLSCKVALSLFSEPSIGWLHLSLPFNKLIKKPSALKKIFNLLRDYIADKFIFRQYERFITPSSASKHIIENRIRKVKKNININVVYNVSALSFDNKYFKKDLDKGSQGVIKIIVIGRISFSDKGQDRLPGIFKKLVELGLAVELIIVGDGPDKEKLRDIFDAQGFLNQINFVGWVPDVAPYLVVADVILIPSRFETFSLAALEAMSMSKRIVANNLACFNEVLPSECLVDSDSANSYAKKIQSVLMHSESHFSELYKPFLFKFSSQSFIRAFDQVIEESLGIDDGL